MSMSVSSASATRYQARVLRVVPEAPDVVTVHLVPPPRFRYQAGQYITVFFDDTSVKEGKAYSLSSYPGDTDLTITVKRVGLFSGRLHALQAGDSLAVSPAYGMFNAFGHEPLLAIASGVGVAPIYSIVRQEVLTSTGRSIAVVTTSSDEASIIFRRDLARLASYSPALTVEHRVTRQPSSPLYGPRISAREVVERYPGRSVCICGTAEFVRAMRQQLTAVGVSDDAILTEVFFEQVAYGNSSQ